MLGDLLQLPPVFEGPVYTPMSSGLITKLTGCVGTINLWRNLFKYYELTTKKKIVSLLTDQDVETLEKHIVPFNSDSVTGRMQEVVAGIAKLPNDTVCLLPTRHMCEQLNNCMLKNLPGKKVQLIGVDTVDYLVHLRQKVSKKLGEYSEDSSFTAGLEKSVIM